MVVVEETVWASSPSMVQRFAHFDLLAVSLLVSSDPLVLVGLRLANPLWLDVTKLFSHFLKLKFADRAWDVVKRAVPQPTVGHTCHYKYPEHGCLLVDL